MKIKIKEIIPIIGGILIFSVFPLAILFIWFGFIFLKILGTVISTILFLKLLEEIL